jgi:hypothetical protein
MHSYAANTLPRCWSLRAGRLLPARPRHPAQVFAAAARPAHHRRAHVGRVHGRTRGGCGRDGTRAGSRQGRLVRLLDAPALLAWGARPLAALRPPGALHASFLPPWAWPGRCAGGWGRGGSGAGRRRPPSRRRRRPLGLAPLLGAAAVQGAEARRVAPAARAALTRAQPSAPRPVRPQRGAPAGRPGPGGRAGGHLPLRAPLHRCGRRVDGLAGQPGAAGEGSGAVLRPRPPVRARPLRPLRPATAAGALKWLRSQGFTHVRQLRVGRAGRGEARRLSRRAAGQMHCRLPCLARPWAHGMAQRVGGLAVGLLRRVACRHGARRACRRSPVTRTARRRPLTRRAALLRPRRGAGCSSRDAARVAWGVP